jgi:hypothetical protein
MTTATTTATTTAILALDLGKYKSVACAYDPAGGEARFHTLPTSVSVRSWHVLLHRI